MGRLRPFIPQPQKGGCFTLGKVARSAAAIPYPGLAFERNTRWGDPFGPCPRRTRLPVWWRRLSRIWYSVRRWSRGRPYHHPGQGRSLLYCSTTRFDGGAPIRRWRRPTDGPCSEGIGPCPIRVSPGDWHPHPGCCQTKSPRSPGRCFARGGHWSGMEWFPTNRSMLLSPLIPVPTTTPVDRGGCGTTDGEERDADKSCRNTGAPRCPAGRSEMGGGLVLSVVHGAL